MRTILILGVMVAALAWFGRNGPNEDRQAHGLASDSSADDAAFVASWMPKGEVGRFIASWLPFDGVKSKSWPMAFGGCPAFVRGVVYHVTESKPDTYANTLVDEDARYLKRVFLPPGMLSAKMDFECDGADGVFRLTLRP